MNQDKMLKDEILDVLAKQLNGGEMLNHGGSAGDVLKFNVNLEDFDEEVSVYFKEPKDKNKPPQKLYLDKSLKKRLNKDDEDFYKSFIDSSAYEDDFLLNTSKKAPAKKAPKKPAKKPAKKAPAKKAAKKEDQISDCNIAGSQARSVMRFYNAAAAGIENNDFKSTKDLQDTIKNLLMYVDDDSCTITQRANIKKALELHNKNKSAPKKKPAKAKKAPAKKPAKKPSKKNVGSFLSVVGEGTIGGRKTIYYDKEEGFEAFYDDKVPKFYTTDKLINETSSPQYKKEWIDSISAPSSKPTHKMPDGAIHTGKKHTKDSKVVKPAPAKAKKPLSEYNKFVKDYSAKNKNLGKDRFKIISKAWEAFKKKSPAKAKKAPAKAKKAPAKAKPAPKICPKGKVLNPATNRCKKVKRVNKNKRIPSAWDIHLKNVREENPQVKGKDIMILAKKSYNKDVNSPKVKSLEESDFEDEDDDVRFNTKTGRPLTDMFNRQTGRKLIDDSNEDGEEIYEDERTDLLQDTSFRNLKESNESLADAFESFDNFGNEIESVANSDMMRRDKEQELNRIRDRFTDYNNLLFNNRDNFTAEAFQRKNKAYDYLVQTFKLAISAIQDGAQNLSLEDYGEEANIQRIIENELAVEQSILHDPEYKYLPPASEDYIDDDEELADLYDFPVERKLDGYINPLYEKVPSISNKINLDYPFNELNRKQLDIPTRSDIRELKKRGPRLITIEEDEEEEVEVKPKPKRKRPLNLRLYQEFLKLMRKNDPSLTRAEITAIWKENKDVYIDMLMDVVDLSGGDMYNEDHYVNTFNNIGGMMCGGDLFEKFTGYKAPDHERRVDSLDDWADTISDIAKGTATGVFNVAKIFSPFSWF